MKGRNPGEGNAFRLGTTALSTDSERRDGRGLKVRLIESSFSTISHGLFVGIDRNLFAL